MLTVVYNQQLCDLQNNTYYISTIKLQQNKPHPHKPVKRSSLNGYLSQELQQLLQTTKKCGKRRNICKSSIRQFLHKKKHKVWKVRAAFCQLIRHAAVKITADLQLLTKQLSPPIC